MPRAKLISKGQLTIPQGVRDRLGLEAGDRIDFVADPLGAYRIVPVRQDVRVLRGRFAGRVSAPVTVEAMVEAEAAERSGRCRQPTRPRRSK